VVSPLRRRERTQSRNPAVRRQSVEVGGERQSMSMARRATSRTFEEEEEGVYW
jgi:hypothetical protein